MPLFHPSLDVSLGTIASFKIRDGASPLTGQGLHGFVQSGPAPCDTAVSCSLLRTRVFDATGTKEIGMGYGEYIRGSLAPPDGTVDTNHAFGHAATPGWHCFYMHLLRTSPALDIQACRSSAAAGSALQRCVCKSSAVHSMCLCVIMSGL